MKTFVLPNPNSDSPGSWTYSFTGQSNGFLFTNSNTITFPESIYTQSVFITARQEAYQNQFVSFCSTSLERELIIYQNHPNISSLSLSLPDDLIPGSNNIRINDPNTRSWEYSSSDNTVLQLDEISNFPKNFWTLLALKSGVVTITATQRPYYDNNGNSYSSASLTPVNLTIYDQLPSFTNYWELPIVALTDAQKNSCFKPTNFNR